MYEPKNLPLINSSPVMLGGVRFGARLSREFSQPDDPRADSLHIHSALEILYNIDSDMSFMVNGAMYRIKPGDVIVSLPGEVHVGIFHKAAVHQHVCMWVEADVNSQLFDFARKDDFCPHFSFSAEDGDRAKRLFISLAELCESDGSELVKTARLLEIITLLDCREVMLGESTLPSAFQRILDDIKENFSEIHSVAQLQKKHFVSSATMTRWFRRYIGVSPREYLESQKLAYAVKLLSGGESVTGAASAAGFSDCSHFIILFKRKFGKTPLQYKKGI